MILKTRSGLRTCDGISQIDELLSGGNSYPRNFYSAVARILASIICIRPNNSMKVHVPPCHQVTLYICSLRPVPDIPGMDAHGGVSNGWAMAPAFLGQLLTTIVPSFSVSLCFHGNQWYLRSS
jgi:hypothetical protein